MTPLSSQLRWCLFHTFIWYGTHLGPTTVHGLVLFRGREERKENNISVSFKPYTSTDSLKWNPVLPSSSSLQYEMAKTSCDYRTVENSIMLLSRSNIVMHRLINASINVKHGMRMNKRMGVTSVYPVPTLFISSSRLSSGTILIVFAVLLGYVFSWIWFHLGFQVG